MIRTYDHDELDIIRVLIGFCPIHDPNSQHMLIQPT